MKFKKIYFLFLVVIVISIYNITFAYTQNTQKKDNSTIKLELNKSKNIIDVQDKSEISVPQTIYLDVSENNKKIQLDAYVKGDSLRTLKLISPSGIIERKYTFNKYTFFEGSKDWIINGKRKIMISDIVECGIWTVQLSLDKDNIEKTSLSAQLIEPYMFSFSNSDKDDLSPSKEENKLELFKDQTYDYYKTYDEAYLDIKNGYIFNINKSFSTKAMPTVTKDDYTKPGFYIHYTKPGFYVHYNNTLDITINLKNLIDGTGKTFVPDSFIKFEIFDPSGEVAYSFYKEGKEIQDLTEITAEIPLYPGEWKYDINFAYTTDGVNPSKFVFAAKFRDLYSEDIKWLIDNKLNKLII